MLFTGEMVFPWMFEDLAGLRPLKGVAEILSQHASWSKLYDVQQLQRNEIPVAAATFVEVCWHLPFVANNEFCSVLSFSSVPRTLAVVCHQVHGVLHRCVVS